MNLNYKKNTYNFLLEIIIITAFFFLTREYCETRKAIYKSVSLVI